MKQQSINGIFGTTDKSYMLYKLATADGSSLSIKDDVSTFVIKGQNETDKSFRWSSIKTLIYNIAGKELDDNPGGFQVKNIGENSTMIILKDENIANSLNVMQESIGVVPSLKK